MVTIPSVSFLKLGHHDFSSPCQGLFGHSFPASNDSRDGRPNSSMSAIVSLTSSNPHHIASFPLISLIVFWNSFL